MTNRRDFLRNASALALGGMALPYLAGASEFYDAKKLKPIGLQLFTLFSSLDDDVQGGLKKVAGVGYKEIESAFSKKGGFYGMKPKEFAAMLKDLGLSWRSHHVLGAPFKPQPGFDTSKFPKMNTLKTDAQQIVDEVSEGGLKYLVCASIPIGTLDEVKQGVEILNNAGELAKKSGITLCYHNHHKEFELVEGQKPYDIFLSQIKPEVMKFELDLAWATKAGVDIPELFQKNPHRFPLFHVKDIDKEGKTPLPVGEGIVDFKGILAHTAIAGTKHFFVEQDNAPKPFENIATSLQNLRKLMA